MICHHQRIRCLGSVHAFHTSVRGASKTRMITSVLLAEGTLFFPVLFFPTAIVFLLSLFMDILFCLQLLEIVPESVEPFFPCAAVVIDPAGSFVEWCRVCREKMFPPLASSVYEPGTFEDKNVLRDGVKRHIEGTGDFRHARFFL